MSSRPEARNWPHETVSWISVPSDRPVDWNTDPEIVLELLSAGLDDLHLSSDSFEVLHETVADYRF